MGEFAVEPTGEPFDFRHQASIYARYRRDYSGALYDAIESRTGAGRGRVAVDLGCGTGLVARSLSRRGWRVVGVDFSAPMLAEARRGRQARVELVRARGEEVPVRAAGAALITCGTAFHWFAPAPALAEMHRVLAPGGWAALFWRYPDPEAETTRLIGKVLRRFRPDLPQTALAMHPPEPFAGSQLVAEPEICIETVLDFTPESFLGLVASVEWIRRVAGAQHGSFLAALREEVDRVFPGEIREPNREYLYLARKPG